MSVRLPLNEVKEIEIEILDYIDRTLKEHNFDYWLDGGTLLGCVRHKGFIPWDDDIDLIVRRSDYLNVLEILNSNSDRFKVISMYNNSNYYYPFAKVTDTTTRIKEKGLRDIDGLGIYVDIFPLDTLPDDERKRKKFFDDIFRLRSSAVYALLTPENYARASIKNKVKHHLGKIYGWKRAIKKVDKLCTESSKNNSRYVVDIVAAWNKNREVPIEVFSETLHGDFEGKKYPIPAGFDMYLTALYGDYMQLPPKKDRVLKHDFIAMRV